LIVGLELIRCAATQKIQKSKEDFLRWKTKTNALISYAAAVSETAKNIAATIVKTRLTRT